MGALCESNGVLWEPYEDRLGCTGDSMGVDWGAPWALWGSIAVLWEPYGG